MISERVNGHSASEFSVSLGISEKQVASVNTMALVVRQFTVATVAPSLPAKENVLKKHPVKVNPELPVK
jgi:hypothetical protein